MRAILIPSLTLPYIVEKDISERNPLRDLYAYLHCNMVEQITPGYQDERGNPAYFSNVRMMVDEDARLVGGQLYNHRASILYGYNWHRGSILGPVVLLGYDKGHWTDLPEGWTVENLNDYFKSPTPENINKLIGATSDA
jgi:hypothetical protein